MKKNDTAVVKIEDIGINGEGIGKADGYTLFIKDTVMGDLVEVKVMKAKKNYGYAKLLRVIEPQKIVWKQNVRSQNSVEDVRSRRWIIRNSYSSSRKKSLEIWNGSEDLRRKY